MPPGAVGSASSGALLTLAVLVVFWAAIPRGVDHARGLGLATLLIGYQILALAERAASSRGSAALLPRSIRSWVVWGAAAVSLPILMYVPGGSALLDIARLGITDWLCALAAAAAAVGWRVVVTTRTSRS